MYFKSDIQAIYDIPFCHLYVMQLFSKDTEGQLNSKGLFSILNSSKKEIKKYNLSTIYDTSGRLVFVCFLEEFEDKKDISKLTMTLYNTSKYRFFFPKKAYKIESQK